jgi:acyl transferase domain-containing protein/acyl carrier protein
MSRRAPAAPNESIAIIGMKGRFPGADSIEKLWQNLQDEVESITSFSEQELRAAGIDPAYLNVAGYVNRGSVLDSVDQFDAAFFGYSARDAETIDPQQRIFLECVWECLEDAGYDPETYPGMIGVFAGSDQSTYLYQIYSSVDLSAYGYGGMMMIGNEKDYLATQVSYKLNLRGPSLTIQTSCSTSLVTVCVACQNLVHGYCDMALAGGVAINIPQKKGYWYSPGGIESPDGHCRPFDAAGQGTVVGNGVGVVLLKRLSDALADGDRIEAVIKGFALNNDGSGKVGYTAPSVDGQAHVIRMAQRAAGVEPDTIGYIEAHGTATALGDPIEIAALTKAFRQRTDKREFCAIGSLKSNLGHLSSAAGVAGLIKGVLAVKHGRIPKSLHYRQPNPEINFAESPFFVPTKLTEWPINSTARRAGVSSFGVGGTNAHIVLEQAPELKPDHNGARKQLLVLSARTATGLEKVTDNLAAYLDRTPDVDLADVAFTCQAGRKAFPHRRYLVFDRADPADLTTVLKTRDPQRVNDGYTEIRDRKVVFMFSGQGTQYVDMGFDLYRTEPCFRAHVDACCDILQDEMGLDLRDVIYPLEDLERAAVLLKNTEMTQPALFTVEYALAQQWMEWGIIPSTMLGHSIGEYVAACLAGVISLEDALALVAMRGRLMGSMPGGSMLAVALAEGAVQPLLSPTISLAAVNAPSLCVLAGPTPAIDAIEQELAAQKIHASRLHTSHAFHSSMMEPVLPQFTKRLKRVSLRAPTIPYLSNVTGAWITPELATSPAYWAAHLRQTVRFGDNLCAVMAHPDLAIVEVGPGRTLSALAQQQGSRAASQIFVSSLRSVHEQVPDQVFIRDSLGKLWLAGVRPHWRGVHRRARRRMLSLPTYPFERQRYWLGPLETAEAVPAQPTADPMAPTAAVTSVPVSPTTLAPAPVMTVPVSPTTLAPMPLPAVAAQARDISTWFAVPFWRCPPAGAKRSGPDGSWLVFTDVAGIGEAVAQRLRLAGLAVVTVARGTSYGVTDGAYQIRAGEAADYDALMRELATRGHTPTRLLHLWSMDPDSPGVAAVQNFEEAQERGYYSVLLLAKSLVKRGGSTPVQIGIVTDRLHRVLGDETQRSAAATVAGTAKVLPQEYPHLRCRMIDLVAGGPRQAEALIDELTSEPFEPVVAYRNGRRWVQEFEPLPLAKPEQPPTLLEDGGVYLITGGGGNIGMILADAIARDVKAKFVLTGRTGLPPREQWASHSAAQGHSKVGQRIRQVQALEALGAEVMVAAVDAADRTQTEALIAAVRQKWGPITGVIHGAANLSPDAFVPVGQVDRGNGAAHFRPKDHGLLLLEELLSDAPPKWWVLLSSISAVLGGLGLASYAAANAFLDAEAQRAAAAQGGCWISINWDAWDFSARAGAAADAIAAAEGGDAFRRILAAANQQVVVSKTPLDARLKQWVKLATVTPQKAPPAAAGPVSSSGNGKVAAHPRPALSTPYTAPGSDTERKVAETWQHFLGVEPIGLHDKFFELGGHSLLAIQLLAQLRELFAIDIPVQRIFEAPTVAALAQSIDRDRAAAPASAPAGNGGHLEEMLNLVESLSDEEVEALLNEAESIERIKERHAGAG